MYTPEFKNILTSTLDGLRAEGLYKEERFIASQQYSQVTLKDGRSVINMCANNYLGLANNPEVMEAAKKAIDQWGFGMASVRFICGTQTLHRQLEERLTQFLGTEDTILFPSCFDANGGLFEGLLTADDAIISDSLNHASIIDGVRLCKAKRFRYANNDMADLEAKLQEADAAGARVKLISTDGVFSMDGIIAQLDKIHELAAKYNAIVHFDDCHATGFLGEKGRGTHEYRGLFGHIDITTGTLGKALGGASGGYVSGPVVRCAAKKGIKTAIHEQNAFPGVTNKLLAPDVDIVFAAVPAAVEKLGAPEKTQVVGNPVRPEVFEKAGERDAIRAQLGAGDRTVILSFGGSLGARRVNEVVADLCAWEQKEHKPVLHIHATGQYGMELFQNLEKEKGFAPGESLVVKEYINNMPELLAAADLVISRAGALTLAELEAEGRAAILIPSPNVAENHQYYNAMELQKAGAAVVIEEKDLTGEKLVSTVSGLLAEPGRLAAMGRNARTLSVDDSLDRIADALMKLVKTP